MPVIGGWKWNNITPRSTAMLEMQKWRVSVAEGAAVDIKGILIKQDYLGGSFLPGVSAGSHSLFTFKPTITCKPLESCMWSQCASHIHHGLFRSGWFGSFITKIPSSIWIVSEFRLWSLLCTNGSVPTSQNLKTQKARQNILSLPGLTIIRTT